MKKIKYIALLASILAFFSCTKQELFFDNAENHFFLENNEAIMPVLVKGNTNSKVFVIVLHGGPGDSGINDFGDNGLFEQLASDYAIVYFDQRCAGLSQGNCDPNTLQVNDFVEDIDKLILTLEHIYGTDISLFLLGHSWGATLGLDYLINGSNINKIKGFIQSDGSHNIPKLSVEQKEILIFYANQQIDLGNNITGWQSILDEVSDANPAVEDDRISILNSTYKTENFFVSVDSVQSPTLNASFSKYLSGVFPATVNNIINSNFTKELLAYDISHQLNQITTPTALYWGKFDMVHPPNMAIDIYNRLGTIDKELYFFEKSFHSPMANENQDYQTKVKEFVELYR